MHGQGRPLVVVPGTLAPLEMYLPLVRLLIDQYTVVLVGRRGYGMTEPGPRPARFERQVEDLVAVLRELPGPALLFGHSFGGLVGLSAALADPARIAGIALYEPPIVLLGKVLGPMLRRCRSAVAGDRPQDAVRLALALSGSPTVRDAGPADTTLAQLAHLVPGLIVDLECTTGMTMPVRHWAGMATPMTLLRGERSTAEYVRSVEALRTLYPDARYEVVPGQAHFPKDMDRVARVFTA
ncbi:alpha/beta hydrolase [Allokutzneria sp. A3M-2-11 16]|uniref:alpha/beta fold hydrolase n=1 Tax=Allokutzneria sp. A3M-2-11 16 TaxID=2962043 RepID=UPI0020B7E9DE|nr:alpha/beta hydrolase [Allokutzneria sp. A3M-2-11 16]MCP3802916.1 alpha/beta hydrolase [Allokutzneria sp. A3M-2-11 16]